MDAYPGVGWKPSTNAISAQSQPFSQAGARALPPLHKFTAQCEPHHILLYPGTKTHVFLGAFCPTEWVTAMTQCYAVWLQHQGVCKPFPSHVGGWDFNGHIPVTLIYLLRAMTGGCFLDAFSSLLQETGSNHDKELVSHFRKEHDLSKMPANEASMMS